MLMLNLTRRSRKTQKLSYICCPFTEIASEMGTLFNEEIWLAIGATCAVMNLGG